ncbi:PQQ-binding-like beta-propeller repeat protein [Kitasatospora sp. MY 5-36]|uniref:outer membrane protein assembly factor BamB family protein n=1 Tax=Kitasatospora sp. MY 5-36 TaxID=1678027 RepID=UPI001F47C1B1
MAVNAETGRQQWPHPAPVDGAVRWLIGHHAVYVVRRTSTAEVLSALDLTDGRLLWEEGDFGGELIAAPLESGRTVHLITGNGHVHARDGATGREVWLARKPAKRVLAGPAVVAGQLYVGAADPHRLFVFNARTGEELAPGRGDGAFVSVPFVVGDTVWAMLRTNRLMGWDVRTRARRKPMDLASPEGLDRAMLVEDGILYVTTPRGLVRAVDLRR